MSDFERQMREYLPKFRSALANDIGDWVVKGFIDTYRNIYTISADTKGHFQTYRAHVVSAVRSQFARTLWLSNYILAEHQNYYPDMTFIDSKWESR